MDAEEYSKHKQFYSGDVPKLLSEYINEVDWKNYLDLGCGDGSLLFALNKKGYFNNKVVYAVDLSENRINLVKKINKDFICFVGDACNIKNIEDGSIDFLTSSQLIEHVSNDGDLAEEIYRILKKNGIVYLSTIFKKWYGWYFYRNNNQWMLDPTHLREYKSDFELLSLFDENKFEVLENRKSSLFFPIIDSLARKLRINNKKLCDNKLLSLLRKIKRPVLGYYVWEIVLKKK